MGPARKSDRHRAWQLFIAAAVLPVLTPYLSSRIDPEAALGIAAVVSFAALSIVRSESSQFDWFHPLTLFTANFFLLFVANGFVILLGISSIITNVFGPEPDAVYELMNRATLYASSFLLATHAGYFFRRARVGGNTSNAGPHREQPVLRSQANLQQLRIAAWLALGCSYLGCIILSAIFGGVGNFLSDPMAFIESRGAFWPIVLIWGSLWSFGFFYASWVRERNRIDLIALSLALPPMLFEFVTGGTKMALLVPVICYLILRNYIVRRLSWKFIPALGVFTLLVFLVGYTYRGAQGSGDMVSSLAEYNDQSGSIFATFFGRFYGTDSFMVVLDATDQGYAFQHGKTLEDLLYFYVPRALWPDKPESYSMTFGREFLSSTPDAGESFFTPSLPGELYLNFGAIGLLAGGFLTGILLREIYFRLILRADRGVGRLLAYAIVMPNVALLVAGPISTVAEYILMRCACFGVFYWFAGYVLHARRVKQFSSAMLGQGGSN